MDANFHKVKQIFLDAVDLPDGERETFIDRACEGDASLREQVDRLLKQHVNTQRLDILTVIAEPDGQRRTLQKEDVIAGRFQIVQFLGRGGMGEVYRATDLELGGSVALKTLRPELLEDPHFLARFRREVQLARQVTHPNVCRIFDFGRDTVGDRALAFLTMEYLNGQTLSAMLRQRGKLTTFEALPLLRQIAAGLTALHENGIVHRDFKPGNVMIHEGGSGGKRAVVADFGLARALESAGTPPGDESGLSRSGHVAGTPDYMAPEQLLGKPLSAATDIYAFGLVIYEMMTGKKVFADGRRLENVVQRVTESPTPPRTHNPELSPTWERVILRCLSKEPGDRPASAVEVVSALADETHEMASPRPKRRPVIALLIIAAMLAGLFLVSRLQWREGKTGSEAVVRHIAVLPFGVVGNNSDLRVFADGLMETITRRLSQYEGHESKLFVVPISEVRAQAPNSPSDARKKFSVDSVVEGSLQSQGERVRLLLTVVDAVNMRQSETIVVEDSRSNAYSLQDIAVTRLANALHARVRADRAADMRQSVPVAPGAYDYYLQARGYLQRNDKLASVESAITILNRAIELDSNYALAYAGLGEAWWYKYEHTRDSKFVEDALRNCHRALQLNANLPEAQVTMGRIHTGTGRYEQALQVFETVLKGDSQNIEAHQGVADAYLGLKQYDKADAAFRQALAIRPSDWTGYKRLATYYYRRGEFDKAIDQYKKVVSLTPDSAQAYLNLGTAYARVEDWVQAKKNWERSLELDPVRLGTISNLAKVEFEAGRYVRSIELYRRALKINELNYLTWGMLAHSYHMIGSEAESRAAYTKAIKLGESELLVNPNTAVVYARIGLYRACLGEKQTVRPALEQALRLGGEEDSVATTAAEAYALIGESDRALGLMQRAIDRGYPLASLRRSLYLKDLMSRLKINKK